MGSLSQRKLDMVKKVVSVYFGEDVTVNGFGAKSGVSETPYDVETFQGAQNRAGHAKQERPGADVYVGLESGLVERYGHIYEEAWAVVFWKEQEYCGYSSGLKVPDYILDKMDQLKKPHSEVMEIVEKEFVKTPSDTWGTYSGGTVSRDVSLEEALRNAMIQALTTNPDSLYLK